jgi:molybdopterin synthase catalytic subunit
MFELTDAAIDTVVWRARIAHPSAGGIAIFEGAVRDHHRGVAVAGLEYTAHAVLAAKQGRRIVAEAAARWPLRAAAGVHRVGRLGIGDLAVWIGVAADHRGEAFDACRWIIDEVKRRVPVWKREWRPDGSVAWVEGVPLEA